MTIGLYLIRGIAAAATAQLADNAQGNNKDGDLVF
jgi:hypothetical protein